MKNHFKPGLYIVSTPIGNLEDITFRAVNILKSSNIILCEDTRITSKLLEHFAIQSKLLVYNDHSDDFLRDKIALMLEEGNIISLVSDAGTPLISDPGYKLVAHLQERGYYIDIAPGPSSVIAALTLSSLPTNRFSFFGFLPRTETARLNIFNEVKHLKSTIIFFDTADRIIDSLECARKYIGDRDAAVAREITKLFQEVKKGKLSELIKCYKENKPRGEIVFLISGESSQEEYIPEGSIKIRLRELLKTYSSKDATEILFNEIGSKTKFKKKEIYKMCITKD